MILDRLEEADHYAPLSPRFAAAFEFLRRQDLADLELGRYDIDGDNVYALIQRNPTRRREDSSLEAHRKYIDIQMVLSGVESIGWKNRPTCTQRGQDYDAETDAEKFTDEPDAWATVHPGAFVIFLPDDTHAPMVGTGEIHKVVVKVLAD